MSTKSKEVRHEIVRTIETVICDVCGKEADVAVLNSKDFYQSGQADVNMNGWCAIRWAHGAAPDHLCPEHSMAAAKHVRDLKSGAHK